ncbi:MAG: DNA-3-methyladenine glycosylase [Patescibacteria group bacterium]
MIPLTFYNQNTLIVARSLLGQFIIREYKGKKLIGKIVETESYVGPKDLASHASRGKTERTKIMFGPPGYSYIYLVYGLNYCFNIVTEAKDYPAAVLIRAVEPIAGIDQMIKNRKLSSRISHVASRLSNLTNGPGKFCQAFAIDKNLNDHPLNKKPLSLEWGEKIKPSQIVKSTRIGVDYAGEYAKKKWRFYIKGNPFVSKK